MDAYADLYAELLLRDDDDDSDADVDPSPPVLLLKGSGGGEEDIAAIREETAKKTRVVPISYREVEGELLACMNDVELSIIRLENWLKIAKKDDFHFLLNTLKELKERLVLVGKMMEAKIHDESISEKHIFLLEASLLLVFPYAFCLLTKRSRANSIGTGGSQTVRDKKWQTKIGQNRTWSVAYAIDPIYEVRYRGVNFQVLFDKIEQRNQASSMFCCSPCMKPKASAHQVEKGRILASRLFGLDSVFKIILHQFSVESSLERDLILERAVGAESDLEAPNIERKKAPYNVDEIELGLRVFQENVLWANAMVSCGFHRGSALLRSVGYGIGGIYYGMPWMRKKAIHQGELCYAGAPELIRPKLEFAQFVWNLPDAPIVKQFYQAGLPKVAVNFEFYIPRLPENPLDYPAPQAHTWSSHDDGLPVQARVISAYPLRRLPSTQTRESALKFPPELHGIPMLRYKRGLLSFLCCGTDSYQSNTPTFSSNTRLGPGDLNPSHRKSLILHFHGGGFISGGSHAHLNYSILWANQLGVPIVSVDYRLAPQHSFPTPFLDCWRAYRWCVECSQEQLGFKAEKIILVGDSAGGNLAAAVCAKAIMDNYRVPDGILLVYPAVDLRRRFTPSMLWSVDDRLIPFTFLECCMAAYLSFDPEVQRALETDPLVSPALCSPDVLARFPKTRIVVGDGDPLHDTVVSFAHKLAKLNVDANISIYEGCIHGVLSFLWPVVGVSQTRVFVDDCASLLDELLLSSSSSSNV